MEKFARISVILLVLLAAGLPLAGYFLSPRNGEIELRARMPEAGGWSLERIEGRVNQPIKLRLISDDVVHGFAVGKSPLPSVEILPGKFSQVELTFEQPGEYTFYCTRWCGPNHWRMRGVIEIERTGQNPAVPAQPPLYQQLGLDLDAPHRAAVLPPGRPSALRGEVLSAQTPNLDADFAAIWSSSPEQTFVTARGAVPESILDDQQVWDMVAWALNRQALPGMLAEGRELYTQNCLACHGESGKGDGVMVRDLPPYDPEKMGQESTRPPDFSDPAVLTGASPALLEGKIMRGGMGTGMPYWGTIFTSDQIRALVLYLYSFQFDFKEVP